MHTCPDESARHTRASPWTSGLTSPLSEKEKGVSTPPSPKPYPPPPPPRACLAKTRGGAPLTLTGVLLS